MGIPANPSNPAHSSNPGILSNPGNPDIQGIPSNLSSSSSLVSFDIKYSLVVSMPHMPFVASPAPIHRHALCFELRVLIEIFPSIVLSLVGLLSLPGVLLASVVLRVRLKRRHFVEVFMSFITHVLFCVVLLSQYPLLGSKRFTFSYPSKEPCVRSTDNINIVE